MSGVSFLSFGDALQLRTDATGRIGERLETPNVDLPRRGDFMAASTMPTSSCRLLGSWARPEAKAASASAWRPRY